MKRLSATQFLRFGTLVVLFLLSLGAPAQKREMRGTWIQCVNGQFQGLSTQAMQQNLTHQLDVLQRDGINCVFFQVRPECDALYASKLEPWSRFLTGRQGQAPSPYWDPLAWMIDQCHRRGMELHAWVNPFRAKTKGTTALAPNNIATTHPSWVFSYDNQLILNPALPQVRNYICSVVDDIVSRYDVDGIHIDDYFYPYPAPGQVIPDEELYRQNPQGFSTIGDWRRNNVNLFMQQLCETIHERKPWVKFGVSPFGIYRNQASDPKNGSATRGLQNYDNLYADVLLWINNGWVDYCVPQIYWQIGHPTADYATLIKWWNKYAENRPLFIGEDVERTTKYADPANPNSHQLPAKRRLHQQLSHVDGSVLWYSKAVVDNVGNYGEVLRTAYWKHPALQPLMPFIDHKAPKKPAKVKARWTADGYLLTWKQPKGKKWGDVVNRYVVYRFAKGEKVDIEDASKILAVTSATSLKLPYRDGSQQWVYVVTALDRLSNESKAVKKKVKL
jgi:uncharacterized lipoprotein YddW (UPF0748 family)